MSNLFIKCKADPDGEKFVQNFKNLHPDFQADLFLGEVKEYAFFKYVVMTYDIESPFVIKYKDWAQRRRETARRCEFPKDGMYYTKEVENIILGKNPRTNRVILSYLFIQNDIIFSQFQAYEFLFTKQLKASLEETYDNPTYYKNLKNNIDELVREIKSLENSIFHGDESKELKRGLYEYASKISLDFRPEDRATKIEQGEEPVDVSPYPDGYKPKVLEFLGDE